MQNIVEMVVNKFIIRLVHLDLHPEHKSCSLPALGVEYESMQN